VRLRSYIIHDEARQDRQRYVDAAKALIPGLAVMPAIVAAKPLQGCSLSHKRCIELAIAANATDVLVLEDDVKFCDDFPFAKFLHVAHRLEAQQFDLILGGVATAAEPQRLLGSPLVALKGFSSTHCVWYRKASWEKVLALTPKMHIDGQLVEARIPAAVIVPFVATQYPSFSTIRGSNVNDEALFEKTEQSLKALKGVPTI
jgi:hypothetical protein